MKLALIAAVGRNRVIGKDGKLPWHIPEDLHRFKHLTIGHTVLMGRKTFESIGKSLPGRRNVVLSSVPIPGIETYQSLQAALTALAHQEKVFVIGGGTIFAQLLGHADEMYLTFVDSDADGDVFFPPYEDLIASSFRQVHKETRPGYTFVDYVRVT